MISRRPPNLLADRARPRQVPREKNHKRALWCKCSLSGGMVLTVEPALKLVKTGRKSVVADRDGRFKKKAGEGLPIGNA